MPSLRELLTDENRFDRVITACEGLVEQEVAGKRGLCSDRGGTAERLLGVTDRKISDASAPVQKTYKGLRKAAKGHVEGAVPGLVSTLLPFVKEGVAA
jgi:hypothetical protein